jgi:hypothetical protein
MEAKIRTDYITLIEYGISEGKQYAVVNCKDFDTYEKLPAAIELYSKVVLAKAGWNSDKQICYYTEDPLAIAKIIKV